VRERGITSTTHQYILTHTQYERADQAPNIGSDDYRNIRRQSAVLVSSLRAPPKSQPQVPAPACPLPPTPTEFTLHYYTSLLPHTPALHATTNSPKLLLLHCPLPLTQPLFSSSIHPSTIPTTTHSLSPTPTKPHHPHDHVSAHINHPARAVLCASDSLIEHQRARTVVKPADPRALRQNSSYCHTPYRHANLIVGDLKSSRLLRQSCALRSKIRDTK